MKNIILSGGKGYLGDAITRTLTKSGFNVLNHRIDVTDEEAVKKYADEIKNEFGNVFAVIHCASAKLSRKKVLEVPIENFKLQFDVNVIGAYNLFKYFSPIISEGGAIVGILSKSIENQTKTVPSGSYIPSKYALKGLLRVLSDELSERGIRVYGVSPAFMPGGLNQDIPEISRQFIMNKSLPDDVTTPEVVAKIILKIINDESKNMNGKSVSVPELNLINL